MRQNRYQMTVGLIFMMAIFTASCWQSEMTNDDHTGTFRSALSGVSTQGYTYLLRQATFEITGPEDVDVPDHLHSEIRKALPFIGRHGDAFRLTLPLYGPAGDHRSLHFRAIESTRLPYSATSLLPQRKFLVMANRAARELLRPTQRRRELQADRDLAEIIVVELRQSAKFLKGSAMVKMLDFLGLIEEVVVEGQSKGLYRRDVDPAVVAVLLVGCMEAVVSMWIVGDHVPGFRKKYDYSPAEAGAAVVDLWKHELRSKDK